MSAKNNDFQWKTIVVGIILVIISLIFVFIYELLSGKVKKDEEQITVPQPNITIEGIQENRGKEEDRLEQTSKLLKVSLYKQPLETPSFVTNRAKLTKYLESNTSGIYIDGEISEAYLYIKTGQIDIEKESVYFWIVDAKSDGGHLLPTENLASGTGNEFLYDLVKLPIIQRPYSISKAPEHIDVVNDYLNKDLSYKDRREYYVGAFVSTTRLPNQVENLEIRYACKQGIICSISLLE